jgi:DNA primase
MGDRWGNGNKESSTVYSPEQVEAVLNDIGVEIVGETHNDFLCYCPYHGNSDTPALTIGRFNGVFYCFNGACNESGPLIRLVKDISNRNDFEALRLIGKYREKQGSLVDRLSEALRRPENDVEFPQDKLDTLHNNLPGSPGYDYMRGRGFDDQTLKDFKIGWSARNGMIFVPVHNERGIPVGGVGRTIKDKRFKNHPGMQPSRYMFNIHRAKRESDTVVIAEASFDVMAVHQAGYPNVIGTLGGYWNPVRLDMVSRHFNKIILLTDEDNPEDHIYKGCRKCYRAGHNGCQGHNPGLELGKTIAESLSSKRIYWAAAQHGQRYPEGYKDPASLLKQPQILREMIKNAVTNYEFQSWTRTPSVV